MEASNIRLTSAYRLRRDNGLPNTSVNTNAVRTDFGDRSIALNSCMYGGTGRDTLGGWGAIVGDVKLATVGAAMTSGMTGSATARTTGSGIGRRTGGGTAGRGR